MCDELNTVNQRQSVAIANAFAKVSFFLSFFSFDVCGFISLQFSLSHSVLCSFIIFNMSLSLSLSLSLSPSHILFLISFMQHWMIGRRLSTGSSNNSTKRKPSHWTHNKINFTRFLPLWRLSVRVHKTR